MKKHVLVRLCKRRALFLYLTQACRRLFLAFFKRGHGLFRYSLEIFRNLYLHEINVLKLRVNCKARLFRTCDEYAAGIVTKLYDGRP